MGFLLGCCGLVLAMAFFRDSLRGALAGLSARIVVGVVAGALSGPPGTIARINPDGSPALPDIPWELVGAFVIGTVFVFGLVAGAIWAFGGGGGDDDDEGPPAPPDDHQYVTYQRR